MKRFFVGYATHEGQAAAIAAHIAGRLRVRGHFVLLEDIAGAPSSLDPLHGCDALVLAASINGRRHEAEMVEFVKQNLDMINAWPSAFISVSHTQMIAESQSASPDERARARIEVQTMNDQFMHDTGWQPGAVKAAAGEIAHSRYSRFERWAARYLFGKGEQASGSSGGDAFGNWPSIDALTDDLETYLLSCSTPEGSSLLPHVLSETNPGRHRLASFRS